MMEYILDKNLWKTKARDLEEYLGKSIDVIEKEYYALLKSEGQAEKRLYECRDSAEVNEFYRITSRYLFELLHWEASFDKQDSFALILAFLRGNRVSRVLDFGGGIGGFALYINSKGIACDYLDIKGRTFDFAEWRFRKHMPGIEMYDALEGFPHKQYDAVVAYDVLEHVPDIPATISNIASLLVQGGYFLVKPTFSGGGIHLKVNERYNDIAVFNAVLAVEKLVYAGRLKPSILSILAHKAGLHLNAGYQISPKVKYGGNFLVYKKS